ncbi:hypothetical protein GCM10010121_071780 [Streptomyces brasiliensis]|uniref:Uncharacterized protein n=1 Tax=Streptomyces brasiliensis TaxID=1954 RepID=A0A917L7I7_9ACTN|nr:hypothetical protein GCM10010121_071780 [Streptomyces brasiliensis]
MPDGSEIGEIERANLGPSGQLRGDGSPFVDMAHREYDAGSGGGERSRGLTPEAAARTSDDRGSAGEIGNLSGVGFAHAANLDTDKKLGNGKIRVGSTCAC